MATTLTLTQAKGPVNDPRIGCFIASWTLANGETGDPVYFPNADIVSVQALGTFASATITMQGANENATASNFATIRDSQGNDLTFTAAGIKQAEGPVVALRPSVAGGGGTTSVTINALLVAKSKG